MQYQHTLGCQQVLQQAIRERRREPLRETRGHAFTWSEIADQLGMPQQRSTLIRFDSVELPDHLRDSGRLFLNYGLAQKLWQLLAKEVQIVLKNGNFKLFSDDLTANAISWRYRIHESQIDELTRSGLTKKDGAEVLYWCYKASFRKKGHIVKSELGISKNYADHFDVIERQESTLERRVNLLNEQSAGFAISKSRKLWMFLKEVDAEQPRIFCLNTIDVSDDLESSYRGRKATSGGRKVTRMFGRLIESDKKFGNGLFTFKVALVRAEIETKEWRDPPRSYDPDKQINNFPRTLAAREAYNDAELRIIDEIYVDPKAWDWIRSDVEGTLDPDARPYAE